MIGRYDWLVKCKRMNLGSSSKVAFYEQDAAGNRLIHSLIKATPSS